MRSAIAARISRYLEICSLFGSYINFRIRHMRARLSVYTWRASGESVCVAIAALSPLASALMMVFVGPAPLGLT